MSEPENFLERWSRKKTEAARDTDTPPRGDDGDAISAITATEPQQPIPQPEFDLTKLPSLESITAATDIRAFLSPGVPHELTRAALRRVWTADPAIRDFVGLAENAWDFNDPNAMPGFGDLPLGYDVKKLVAEVFGELKQATDPANPAPPVTSQSLQETDEFTPALGRSGGEESEAQAFALAQAESREPSPPPSDDFVQRENIAASQYLPGKDEDLPSDHRPRHGGALPK
jgi:hypothetical protein